MAVLVNLRKMAEDDRSATYWFQSPDGPRRTLIFNKQEETITPEDGIRDGQFRASAGRLARAWARERALPANETCQS